MKNGEVKVMLLASNEISEFKSTDIDFIWDFLRFKKKITEHVDELDETLKKVVEFTDEEKALVQKTQGLSIEQILALEDENPKLTEGIKEKNKLFSKKHAELMEKEANLKLPKFDKDKLPEGMAIKHYEALYPVLK